MTFAKHACFGAERDGLHRADDNWGPIKSDGVGSAIRLGHWAPHEHLQDSVLATWHDIEHLDPLRIAFRIPVQLSPREATILVSEDRRFSRLPGMSQAARGKLEPAFQQGGATMDW